MTEQQQETEAAPVRVPNVSPGAVSGLDHEVIGANAGEAYDENQRLAMVNPPVDPEDVEENGVGGEAPEVTSDEGTDPETDPGTGEQGDQPAPTDPETGTTGDDGAPQDPGGTETPADGSQAGSGENPSDQPADQAPDSPAQ